MEKIFEQVYDELYDGYNSWKEKGDDVIMEDCHPCINWDEWDYQFCFDEEGNVYCLPNECDEAYCFGNLDEGKTSVLAKMSEYLKLTDGYNSFELSNFLYGCGYTDADCNHLSGVEEEPWDEIPSVVLYERVRDAIMYSDEYNTDSVKDWDEAEKTFLEGYGNYWGGSYWLNPRNNKYYFSKNN